MNFIYCDSCPHPESCAVACIRDLIAAAGSATAWREDEAWTERNAQRCGERGERARDTRDQWDARREKL